MAWEASVAAEGQDNGKDYRRTSKGRFGVGNSGGPGRRPGGFNKDTIALRKVRHSLARASARLDWDKVLSRALSESAVGTLKVLVEAQRYSPLEMSMIQNNFGISLGGVAESSGNPLSNAVKRLAAARGRVRPVSEDVLDVLKELRTGEVPLVPPRLEPLPALPAPENTLAGEHEPPPDEPTPIEDDPPAAIENVEVRRVPPAPQMRSVWATRRPSRQSFWRGESGGGIHIQV